MAEPSCVEKSGYQSHRSGIAEPDRHLAGLVQLCEAQSELIRGLRASLNQAQQVLADQDRDRVLHAHDVTMPLNRILDELERLAIADVPDEVVAALLQAAATVDRVVRLVGAHALEPGRQVWPGPRHSQAVDVAALFREMLDEAAQALAGRPVRVQVDPGLQVHTSPAMVRRLLRILLVNAAEHTPGGTDIELVGERSGAGVAIRVCDRGPGLPPDVNLARLELRPDGTAGPRGGIGLLTARTIAESLGGLIGAVGRLGGGVEATFWLPDSAQSGVRP